MKAAALWPKNEGIVVVSRQRLKGFDSKGFQVLDVLFFPEFCTVPILNGGW